MLVLVLVRNLLSSTGAIARTAVLAPRARIPPVPVPISISSPIPISIPNLIPIPSPSSLSSTFASCAMASVTRCRRGSRQSLLLPSKILLTMLCIVVDARLDSERHIPFVAAGRLRIVRLLLLLLLLLVRFAVVGSRSGGRGRLTVIAWTRATGCGFVGGSNGSSGGRGG